MVTARHIGLCLAGSKTLQGFLTLMGREFGGTAKSNTSFLGPYNKAPEPEDVERDRLLLGVKTEPFLHSRRLQNL